MNRNCPNYPQELERALQYAASLPERPRLLLQACCGPCATVALERVTRAFRVTLFYENPNTQPQTEYLRRLDSLRLCAARQPEPPEILAPEYNHRIFLEAVRGLEAEPEGGARCVRCWELRLRRTAREAVRLGYDWMGTTLTLGPTKQARIINPMGEALAAEHGLRWLDADFKKGGGYARSLELSRAFGLYRQTYCGCEFARGGGK